MGKYEELIEENEMLNDQLIKKMAEVHAYKKKLEELAADYNRLAEELIAMRTQAGMK